MILYGNFEPAMTFEEFIAPPINGFFAYGNFFYNFYVHPNNGARNYTRLKKVNQQLADELSNVYEKFFLSRDYVNQTILAKNLEGYTIIEPHRYPLEILQKGYVGYLLLRFVFNNNPELLLHINQYTKEKKEGVPDDSPAFFS